MTLMRLAAIGLCIAVLAFGIAAALDSRRGGDPEALAGTGDPVILAAGDVAVCTTPHDELTANLLDTLEGTVLTLGDLAYENGTAEEFTNCYDPTWGRHKARTMPSPGNHEYNTPGAPGYYGYFGAAAGDPTKGYYSFDIGAWHLISLNSNCSAIGGCGAGSAQEQWLRADLRAHPTACTLAYWHHPRFSSGNHGNNSSVTALYQALYDYGADVVLAGHDHHYERFGPQTPAGAADAAYGVRSWVVGTGGRALYPIGAPKPNQEAINNTSYGVLSMTLHASSYDYSFLPAVGSSFTESGTASCHGAALDPDSDGWLNAEDNCPSDANSPQSNADANFVSNAPVYAQNDTTWIRSDNAGDACDADDDNDGLLDADELSGAACASVATDPLQRDTDGDRYLDGAECARSTNPTTAASKPLLTACGPAGDSDGDKLLDRIENCHYGSNPASANSDGDGCTDGREVASVNGDAVVNVGDVGMVVSEIARVGGPPKIVNLDINKDGVHNIADRGIVASLFGACP